MKVVFYDKEKTKKAEAEYLDSLSDYQRRVAFEEGIPLWIGTNLGKRIEKLEELALSYRKKSQATKNSDEEDFFDAKERRCNKLRNKLLRLVDSAGR